MYKRVITPSAKRSLKKLSLELREKIISSTKILEGNPLAGESLTGGLRFLYSLHFRYQGVQYRVAYTIDHNKKLVLIPLPINERISTRSCENFFNWLAPQLSISR